MIAQPATMKAGVSLIAVLLAAALSLLASIILGSRIIALLKTFIQPVRDYMPKEILAKKTPTMGGVLIILVTVLGTLMFAPYTPELGLAVFVIVGYALVGLLDDVIKVVLKRPLGLKARYKLVGQILIASPVALYALNSAQLGGLAIPFTENSVGLPAWALALLVVLTLIATSNAVNFTDGMDGLAASTTAITAFVLAAVVLTFGRPDLAVLAGALGGACLGFSWFNSYPAQVIMGDVGALGLGAGLATVTILSGTELYLFLAGGVFVLESLSVMMQVVYFRLTHGRRIFRMAPIHYHFQKGGWSETVIVTRFTLVAVLFGLITLLALPR